MTLSRSFKFLTSCMLFLFAIGVSAQNADLHINFEDRGIKAEHVFELGDDGFLIMGRQNGERHLEAYSPDLKLKWQVNFSKSIIPEVQSEKTQVIYNDDRIFICTLNALDKYNILVLDHNGIIKNSLKGLSIRGIHICFCPTSGGIGVFTQGVTDIAGQKFYYTTIDNSLNNIQTKELNFENRYSNYIGTDGTNSYFSSVQYKTDESGSNSVTISHVDSNGLLHNDFTVQVKPGALYSYRFTDGNDHNPQVNVRYDSYTNTFYMYSIAGKALQNFDNWKNFYIQRYDDKGKLMSEQLYSFKDVQAKVPDFPDFLFGHLALDLYTDRFGHPYMIFYYPRLKEYHDACLMFDENLQLINGVCNSKKPHLNSYPFPGLDLYQQIPTYYTYLVNHNNPESKTIEQHSDKTGKLFCTLYSDDKSVLIGALSDNQFDVYKIANK